MAHLIDQIFRSIFRSIGQFFELFVQRFFIHGIVRVTLPAKFHSMKRKEAIALAFQCWIRIVTEINASFLYLLEEAA